LAWGGEAKALSRLGLNAAQFARQQLDLLGIGQELSRITFGANYCLPPSALPDVAEVVTPA
jgi:hypothetical protein